MTQLSDMKATWADGATTFSAIKMDVTDTASGGGSNLLDLLVGGVSKFSVGKAGDALVNGVTVGRGVTDDVLNTVIGRNAGTSMSSAEYNTFLGYEVGLAVTTGSQNVFGGFRAGYSVTSGVSNVFLGMWAGVLSTTASGSVAVGKDALYSSTTNPGTAVGYQALYNATGAWQSALGYQAGYNTTTGTHSVFIGDSAGRSNTTGGGVIAIGAHALYSSSVSNFVVAIGRNSGRYISSGSNLTSAPQSLFIGYDTRASADGEVNQIVIGHQAVGNGSNTVTLGGASITDTYLQGTLHFGAFTTNVDAPVNGYITIVDASGVTRKLATIA